MKKKILGLMFVLFILCAFMPVIANAYNGTQYDDYLYYQINNDQTGVTITDCDSSATEVVIPNEIENLPVTSIGARAFDSCSSITSVTIPNSVTHISCC